ncbi:MAG: hypothetical protein II150_09505 [Thermoguttaceae bacterium]|nr:hypothetical protein [Thermoguttaceae bacterium]
MKSLPRISCNLFILAILAIILAFLSPGWSYAQPGGFAANPPVVSDSEDDGDSDWADSLALDEEDDDFEYEEPPEVGGPKIYVLALFDITDEQQGKIFYEDAHNIERVFREDSTERITVFWGGDVYPQDDEWYADEADDGSRTFRELYLDQLRLSVDADSSEYDVFSTAIDFLKKQRVNPTDALFVYWSGHGTVRNGKYYLQQANGKERPRQDLLDAARGCGARLTVFITDSCASFEQSRLDSAKLIGPSAPIIMSVPPLIEELFFNYRGVLDVNSSSENEKAYSYNIRGATVTFEDGSKQVLDAPSGGCFTLGLTGSTAGTYPFYRQLANVLKKQTPLGSDPMFSHGDFRGAPFGAFSVFSKERKSWRDVLLYSQNVANIIFRNMPDYETLNQQEQHIRLFSEPTRITDTPKPLFSMTYPLTYLGGDVDDYDKLAWSKESIYSPEVGDEILEINGIPIYEDDFMEIDSVPGEGGEPDYDDYPDDEEEEEDMGEVKRNRVYTLVKDSPDVAVIKFKDRKSGKNYYFRTKLGPKGSVSRLGLTPALDKKGAVVVGSIVRGSSAQKGQFAWE